MKIQFKRKAKGWWTDAKVDRVKVAARWAGARLGFTTLPITIVIRLVGPHPSEFGSCSMVDDTRYIIWLQAGLDADRTISTLFHEMTHVYQHMFEGLVLHSDFLADFRHQQHKISDYWQAPWEKAARDSERKLLTEFLGVY